VGVVVETGSFGAAGGKLNHATSAISYGISNLACPKFQGCSDR
jgi:DNA-binding transcriptional LysR family regulator